ncbi:uncharacterized protein [Chamaea fasciata]|uniref:uncharacterized protein n=1 Tax=Chamaea fasciata TaxID=190680 RepID=UPI00336A5BCA
MDPAVPRATLKVLALCAALLALVAAVTVAVAVMVWRSEALGQLRGCRERAANESRELGERLQELRRQRDGLRRDGDTLRQELQRARGDSGRDKASLASCRQRAVARGPAWRPMSPRWGTSWWRCGASGPSWPVTKRRCKRRRGGCGGGCRRRWSSSGSCGSAGSAARGDSGSSRTPSGTTRPSWRRCGGGAGTGTGTGTEPAAAGVPRPGRAEDPQPPRPRPRGRDIPGPAVSPARHSRSRRDVPSAATSGDSAPEQPRGRWGWERALDPAGIPDPIPCPDPIDGFLIPQWLPIPSCVPTPSHPDPATCTDPTVSRPPCVSRSRRVPVLIPIPPYRDPAVCPDPAMSQSRSRSHRLSRSLRVSLSRWHRVCRSRRVSRSLCRDPSVSRRHAAPIPVRCHHVSPSRSAAGQVTRGVPFPAFGDNSGSSRALFPGIRPGVSATPTGNSGNLGDLGDFGN